MSTLTQFVVSQKLAYNEEAQNKKANMLYHYFKKAISLEQIHVELQYYDAKMMKGLMKIYLEKTENVEKTENPSKAAQKEIEDKKRVRKQMQYAQALKESAKSSPSSFKAMESDLWSFAAAASSDESSPLDDSP